MKKLIVLSVIFALVAGSVFAADVSVDVHGGANLVKTSNVDYVDGSKDGKPVYVTDRNGTSYGISRVRIGASGGTEDGTVGGWLRYELGGGGAGFVYWKPSDLFKLQIGQNPDGEFGLDGVARWGFYQIAGDVGVASEGWAFGDSFFGGYGGAGVILTSAPAEGIAINIGIPLVGTTYGAENKAGTEFNFGKDYAYQNYKRFTLQVKYDIAGLGTAGITYQNSDFVHDLVRDASGKPVEKDVGIPSSTKGGPSLLLPNNDNPNLWVYFGLSSIENLGIDVGIGYKFADDYIDDTTKNAKGEVVDKYTYTTNNPLAVGLGVNFNAGALGVKARIQGKFGGSYETKFEHTSQGGSDKSETKTYTFSDGYGLIIDVQPSFALNDKLTAYVSTGIAFTTGDEYVDMEESTKKGEVVIAANTRSLVNWHVNPYVVITPSYWSGAFFAGIRLDSPSGYFWDGEKGDVRNRIVNFSIPIGIAVSF